MLYIKMTQARSPSLSKLTREQLEARIYLLESEKIEDIKIFDTQINSLFEENTALRAEISNLKAEITVLSKNEEEAVLFLDGVKSLLSQKDYDQLRRVFELDPPVTYTGCLYSCPSCLHSSIEETCEFCNSVCSHCDNIRKAKIKITTQKAEKDVRKSTNRDNRSSPQPDRIEPIVSDVPQILTSTPGLIDGDRYLFVTLTTSPTWGSREYLKTQLIKNFNKMSPPSYCPIATAYVVADNESGELHLHGLIRYDWERVDKKKCKVSASTGMYKNIIQIEGTKGKAGQQEGLNTIENISEYSNRKYKTLTSLIVDKWNYLRNQHGQIYDPIGDKLDNFL